jgi:hypothetical protein
MATDAPEGTDSSDPARENGEDIEEVNTTDVEVEAHVPFGMTGSFPLRLAEVFFAEDGLYIAEYSYVTPFVGLTTGKHRREAKAMGAIYEEYGLDAVMVQADSVVWHSYDNVERVVVHEGGWLGRPKLSVYPAEGPSHAYRFHDRTAWAEALPNVEAAADRNGLSLDRREGLGFTPRESVRRFFWKPDD